MWTVFGNKRYDGALLRQEDGKCGDKFGRVLVGGDMILPMPHLLLTYAIRNHYLILEDDE